MRKASAHPCLLSLGMGAVQDLKVCYQGQLLRADELTARFAPGTGAWACMPSTYGWNEPMRGRWT